MNKFIFSCILFSLILFSCGNKSNENLQNIREAVESVESIVNTYDKNVQSAIDTKNFDYIKIVSKEAVISVDIYLEKLTSLQQNSPNDELIISAIAYIGALKEIIIAEELYSALTDTLSLEEGKRLDANLIQALEKAEMENSKYTAQIENLTANQ